MKCLAPSIPTLDMRVAETPQRFAPTEAFYSSPQYRQWATLVKRRAGFQCQAPGCMTPKRGRGGRLFADHRREIRDGGSALDLSNGWCLCPQCHAAKTAAERKRREGD